MMGKARAGMGKACALEGHAQVEAWRAQARKRYAHTKGFVTLVFGNVNLCGWTSPHPFRRIGRRRMGKRAGRKTPKRRSGSPLSGKGRHMMPCAAYGFAAGSRLIPTVSRSNVC